MKTAEAIKFFGTQNKLAAALGTNQSTVGSWKEYPPELQQLRIQALTNGALRAVPGILPKPMKAVAHG